MLLNHSTTDNQAIINMSKSQYFTYFLTNYDIQRPHSTDQFPFGRFKTAKVRFLIKVFKVYL